MKLTTTLEQWPLKKTFRTSQRSFDVVETVLVTLEEEGAIGRGESVGVNYHDETAKIVCARIEQMRDRIEAGITREELAELLPAGGARNALDCALWDLECKREGKTIWELTGTSPEPVMTAFTIVIDEPHRMYEAAADAPESLLKIKVTADNAAEQVTAVREARPDARLIVDGNQDFSLGQLEQFIAAVQGNGVEMIEQPLASDADEALAGFASPIPLCADESFQGAEDIDRLAGRYRYASIKLEKTGGLTAALTLVDHLKEAGINVMTGCWAATSLSMAPAFVIASQSSYSDIDGPLLLARDRQPGMVYRNGIVSPPTQDIWG